MIISIDYTGKGKTIYQCDMCTKKYSPSKVQQIYTSNADNYSKLKKWDLCERCYGYLERYVDNVKQKFIERRKNGTRNN